MALTIVHNSRAMSSIPALTGCARLLVVWTLEASSDTASDECQAWSYSPAGGGTIYTTHTWPTKIMAPTTSLLLASWDILVEDVTPIGGAAVFAKATATSVTMSLRVGTGDQDPVLVSSTAASRVRATGSVPCFH